MNKREEQRLKRREEILNCSLDMLISRGFEAMKIRDIAAQLNISTGLFFNYFESKEKVYEELVKIGLLGPENVLKIATDDISPIELFEKMTAAIFESLQSYSLSAKMFLLMAQTMKSESAPEGVKNLITHFDPLTPVLPIIIKGQSLGQIKEGDPAALAIAYWGAVQGTAESFAIHPDWPMPKSSWLVDILRA